MRATREKRRWPIGAEIVADGVHFRVWAPAHREAQVVLNLGHREESFALEAEEKGYFSALVAKARPGMLYRFRLGEGLYPDPASRFQPEGPHGPSEIIDPRAFAWSDANWKGVGRE